MNTKHFTRFCRHSLDRTPAEHVTALRIQQAALQLATTDDKVESIAQDVGYRSLFAFSHTFKKVTRSRPSEYRKQ